jgi:8-amino-7-oxononanoate synthase
MFTASGTPGSIAAARAALGIVRSDEGPALFARVRANARYLATGLGQLGFDVFERSVGRDGQPLDSPIIPVVIGDDWLCGLLWKELYDAGVYTNLAIYPAVSKGGALLRTSVMATHTREHLDRALAIFEQCRDRLPTDLDIPAAFELPAARQAAA